MTTIALPSMSRQIATNKQDGIGMDLIGPRTLRGIVFHRALSGDGGAQGVADWLKRSDVQGLTDLVIDHRTGAWIRINEITGTNRDLAGWANGPYQSGVASDDARAFVAKFGARYGASVINADLESVEVSGNYDTPISEACKAGLVQWTAARAQQLGCTSDSFPVSPKTGLTVIYAHREFCGTAFKLCSGSVVWDFINGEMIGRVKALLKAAEAGQTVKQPIVTPAAPVKPSTVYATPNIPAFLTDEAANPVADLGGSRAVMVTDQYRTIRATPRLQYADRASARIGPDIPAGSDFNIAYVLTDNAGKDWGLSPYGSRIDLADCERISDKPLAA